MARWSDVGEPDDTLRADDPLLGAEHEDVLLGSDAADDAEPDVRYADPVPDDADESAAPLAVLDDRPTTEIPAVVGPAPAPRGRLAGVAPWAVFAAVAVVVITATSTLASWLQGPTADREGFTGLIQVPTSTASAPPPPAQAAPTSPPAAEPTPEPKREPAPRPTQRHRVTRAPAPPPPAAAVSAPTTSEKKKPEGAAPTTAGSAAAAEQDDAPDTTAKSGAAKTGAKDDTSDKTKSDGEDSNSDDK